MASSLHYYPSCIMYYRVARMDVTPDMEKPEKPADWDTLASPARLLSLLYLFHFLCDIHPSYCICVGILGICTFAIEFEVRVASSRPNRM